MTTGRSGRTLSGRLASLHVAENTSVVSAGDGPESLLARGVPNLQLAHLSLDLVHLEAEIDADGGQVVVDEVVVAVPDEEGGLADALVAHDHHLEEEILLFDHNYYHRVYDCK